MNALNTGVHRNTGLILPAATGYILTLGRDNLLPFAPFAIASGGAGGSTNPVGDYCYVPSLETGNTILFAGGHADHGTSCGRFCGAWGNTAGNSSWARGPPLLKDP